MGISRFAKFRDSVGGETPPIGGTYDSINWDTTDENDGVAHIKDPTDVGGDNEIFVLETTQPILVHAVISYEQATNDRANLKAKIYEVLSQDLEVFTTFGTAYFRNNTNQKLATIHIWAYLHNGAVGDEFRVAHKQATTDLITGGTIAGESYVEMFVVNFEAVGIYQSTGTTAFNGTSYSDMQFNTPLLETDTDIIVRQVTPNNDGADLEENGEYLIIHSLSLEVQSGSNRTARRSLIHFSNNKNSSGSTVYLRNSTNPWGSTLGYEITEQTSPSANDVSIKACRGSGILAGEGGAESDGDVNIIPDESRLMIFKLPSDGDHCRSWDNTAEQDVTGSSPVDLTGVNVFAEWGNGFLKDSSSQIEIQKTMKLLFMANIGAFRENVDSDVRIQLQGQITVGGGEKPDTQYITYCRGGAASDSNQVLGSTVHPVRIADALSGDLYGASANRLGSSAGGQDQTQSGIVGFFGINLDSVTNNIWDTVADSIAFNGTPVSQVQVQAAGSGSFALNGTPVSTVQYQRDGVQVFNFTATAATQIQTDASEMFRLNATVATALELASSDLAVIAFTANVVSRSEFRSAASGSFVLGGAATIVFLTQEIRANAFCPTFEFRGLDALSGTILKRDATGATMNFAGLADGTKKLFTNATGDAFAFTGSIASRSEIQTFATPVSFALTIGTVVSNTNRHHTGAGSINFFEDVSEIELRTNGSASLVFAGAPVSGSINKQTGSRSFTFTDSISSRQNRSSTVLSSVNFSGVSATALGLESTGYAEPVFSGSVLSTFKYFAVGTASFAFTTANKLYGRVRDSALVSGISRAFGSAFERGFSSHINRSKKSGIEKTGFNSKFDKTHKSSL